MNKKEISLLLHKISIELMSEQLFRDAITNYGVFIEKVQWWPQKREVDETLKRIEEESDG